jgi:D-arabinose 1-dehydrogenase-like Zn-dependent alcohol dehydrogenase
MRAAVLEALNQPFVVRDVPSPELLPGGVLLRVEANGICRSDWHIWRGDWGWVGIVPQLPMVIGHEFCGVVEEVGAGVTRWKKGDRVIVPFSGGEGSCEWCRTGHQNMCDTPVIPGLAFGGGYGRYSSVPHADVNLVRLPDEVGFVEAASMGCRFMTSFHGVVDQAQVRAGEWVAVHGCGGIGLSAIQIAAALGARVIAVDVSDEKLAFAKEFGAEATVNAARDDVTGAIATLTGGGAQVSIDALGIAVTCVNSILSLRKRGRHLQIGLTTAAEQGMVPVPIDAIVFKELQIIGSLGMQAPHFAAMLAMVEAKKLDPGKLVARTVGLEDVTAVVESMGSYGTTGVTVITQY